MELWEEAGEVIPLWTLLLTQIVESFSSISYLHLSFSGQIFLQEVSHCTVGFQTETKINVSLYFTQPQSSGLCVCVLSVADQVTPEYSTCLKLFLR